MANVFDKLGREVLPKVFGKLSGVGLTDLMDIRGMATTQGAGGGVVKNASPVVYKDIPVVFRPGGGSKFPRGEKMTSSQVYTVQFPTYCESGDRIDIDPVRHRLHIQARLRPSEEPCKVFRIIAVRDVQGNVFEADVVKED
jgi:hypothetical protein